MIIYFGSVPVGSEIMRSSGGVCLIKRMYPGKANNIVVSLLLRKSGLLGDRYSGFLPDPATMLPRSFKVLFKFMMFGGLQKCRPAMLALMLFSAARCCVGLISRTMLIDHRCHFSPSIFNIIEGRLVTTVRLFEASYPSS